jgi:hypothetical protein
VQEAAHSIVLRVGASGVTQNRPLSRTPLWDIEHPEDIPGRSLIKFRAEAPSIAQGNDHAFLPLVTEAFSLLFNQAATI